MIAPALGAHVARFAELCRAHLPNFSVAEMALRDASARDVILVSMATEPELEITPREFVQRQQLDEELVLLDVREHWERQTACIEPSRHIPMADIPSSLWELDPEKHIVVYCHHGVRSLTVTDWLRRQGYEHVQSMAGGIDRWSVQVDSKVPRY